MTRLEQLVKELPEDLQREVEDFAQFLLDRRTRPKGKRLNLNWAGALSEFRDKYTSLDLQKKCFEWRGD